MLVNFCDDDISLRSGIESARTNSAFRYTNRNLTGSYSIVFCNCSIILNNAEFENTEIFKVVMLLIVPLDGLHIEKEIIETSIQDLQMQNRIHLETLSTSHQIHHYSSINSTVEQE